jgi:two-component system phosphate regulon response regulator PhoB
MKVLVVDDDEDQLSLRCLILERKGFETVQAKDPVTALKLSRNCPPDCALVDLLLPTEAAGLKLLRQLRALDPTMRLIVLTGMRRESIVGRLEGVADQIVEKGAGTAALVEIIRRCARKS